MRRLFAAALGAVLLVAALPAAGPFLARAGMPAPAPAAGRVVAIGDIHGEFEGFVQILRHTRLIDSNRKWIGGKTTLIQTGDYTDRGPGVRAVMDLLMSLEKQAEAAGGRLITLLGNHETMNLMGEVRDVTPQIYASFADERSEERREAAFEAHSKLVSARGSHLTQVPPVYSPPIKEQWMASRPLGFVEYRQAFQPDGLYGKWLRTKDVVVQIGNTIFLHAGIPPETAPRKLEDLNSRIRREVKDFDATVDVLVDRHAALRFFTLQETIDAAAVEYGISKALPPTDDLLQLAQLRRLGDFMNVGQWSMLDPNGPMWFRGYAMWTSEEGTPKTVALLQQYGAEHFAVGHTATSAMNITPRFSSQVFLLDTGMLTSVYGGKPSALEIENGKFTAIYLDREQPLIKP